MAISTRKNLRLVFDNTAGSTFTITLPEPKEDLTAAQIETAMDLVIARDIFTTTGGNLVGKRDIKIVDTVTNDLYDPPIA